MNKPSDINISVLFVEDNTTIRMLYAKLLEKRVAKVLTGENGLEGFNLYQQHRPDLILTDISMPVMNGLEMIKRIREVQPDVKVVVMSAYSNNDYFLEAINLGVSGYLLKPVEAPKLFAIIEDLAAGILMRKELELKEIKRQEAEESLKRSLAEKDILLREVHHRVKNNMQIISSILRMQERLVSDQSLIAILSESQNRIRSMALIHEHLYQSENLADIKFDNYVKSLAVNLARTYAGHQGKVKFVYDIADARFPLDVGIPCGLIINELISNSFKYAFADRESGTITIRLADEGDNKFTLEIGDNGTGIGDPASLQKSGSLGMKIVHKLVSQIEGEIAYDFSEGTKFIIKFKI
jgi:two-component sensor histidine kinase